MHAEDRVVVGLGVVERGDGSAAYPQDNADIESFNGRLREECLNVHGFRGFDGCPGEVAGLETGGQ